MNKDKIKEKYMGKLNKDMKDSRRKISASKRKIKNYDCIIKKCEGV